MKTEPPNPPGMIYRICCFILPLIALVIIYELTEDLAYSLVASIPTLVRFIYELNSDNKI